MKKEAEKKPLSEEELDNVNGGSGFSQFIKKVQSIFKNDKINIKFGS